MEYHDLDGEKRAGCPFLILFWTYFLVQLRLFSVLERPIYFPCTVINLINYYYSCQFMMLTAMCLFMLMSLILPTRVYMF